MLKGHPLLMFLAIAAGGFASAGAVGFVALWWTDTVSGHVRFLSFVPEISVFLFVTGSACFLLLLFTATEAQFAWLKSPATVAALGIGLVAAVPALTGWAEAKGGVDGRELATTVAVLEGFGLFVLSLMAWTALLSRRGS